MSNNSPSLLDDLVQYSQDLFSSLDFLDSPLPSTSGQFPQDDVNNNNLNDNTRTTPDVTGQDSAAGVLTATTKSDTCSVVFENSEDYGDHQNQQQQQEFQQFQQSDEDGDIDDDEDNRSIFRRKCDLDLQSESLRRKVKKKTFTCYQINATSVLTLKEINNVTDIETRTLRLKEAIEDASDKFLQNSEEDSSTDNDNSGRTRICTLGRGTGDPNVFEVISAARRVNTYALELLEKVGNEVAEDSRRKKVILEAFFVVSELYERFIDKEDDKMELEMTTPRRSDDDNDIMKQLGMDSIVTWIKDFLMTKVEKTMDGQIRGNFISEVIDRLRPERMRKMILNGIIDVFRIVSNRMISALAAMRSGLGEIIDIADLDVSFRLLQIMEQIIITTNSHPWIMKDDVRKLIQLERSCQINLKLFTVQILVSRVVTLARKKEIITNVVMDCSMSDDDSQQSFELED